MYSRWAKKYIANEGQKAVDRHRKHMNERRSRAAAASRVGMGITPGNAYGAS